jgi:hypothetical protein
MTHLCYFQSLAIVNSAAVNMGVQMALLYPEAHSFQYMPKSEATQFCMDEKGYQRILNESKKILIKHDNIIGKVNLL